MSEKRPPHRLEGRHHARSDERRADGHLGHLDRQRRAVRYPRQLWHADRSNRVGVDGLHDGQHRHHPADWLVSASLRLQALLRVFDPAFTLASALCGLAWNLPSLVLFRILQGMGGGAIIPTAQSILFARYPREEHGMAGALFGLGAVTGPPFGPTVGGYLIQIASWHWIFLINVPVGIVATYLAWRHLDQPGYSAPKESIDITGIVLLGIGMATLQYVLEEGNRDDWWENRLICGLAIIAAIALLTFIVHELETPHPVVDLRVFRNVSYHGSTIINFLIGMTLFSSSYLFSLYCGVVMRYTALDIGTVFLCAGFVQIFFLMPLIGKFSSRRSTQADADWYRRGQHQHVDDRAPDEPGQLLGSGAAAHGDVGGLAFLFVPLSMVALSDLPLAQRGNATGLFNLTRELGGSMGTAYMSVALDRSTKLYALHLRENINPITPSPPISCRR